MKNYAYLDKGGILHVVKDEKTAREFSKSGKVVETELTAAHGYPVMYGDEVIVYSETEMKLDAGEKEGLDIGQYQALAELYRQCK